jgi:two-component system OmpR family sensor kinase
MRFHSIFFKLNLIFIVALIATVLAGAVTALHLAKRDQTELLIQSRLLIREHRATHTKPTEMIQEFGLIEIPRKQWSPILKSFKTHRKALSGEHHRLGAAHVVRDGGYWYLWIHARHFKILLRQQHSVWHQRMGAWMVFGGMMVLLGVLYGLLRKSLLPIRRLQCDIVRYGQGDVPAKRRFSDGQDEIAQVGNAFYDSARQTDRLIRSRQLFVRNIFHELNTPVTKGKILAELVGDPKTQSMLDSIFSRLASLLKELAQMEQITSHDTVLHMQPVRVIELIDQARDLLFLDETIPTNITDEAIEANFATMSIAFKNLIDNGRKYGKNLTIVWRDEGIDFVSEGEPLTQPLSYYIEPFSAGDTRTNEGFGLGLYIVNEIAKKHGMELMYHCHQGRNVFTISFRASNLSPADI